MDVLDAITTRHSTRAFLSRPVPDALIHAVLDAARYAPSGSNIQPWRVHVVTGAARDRLTREVLRAATEDPERYSREYDYYPPVWREPYLARRRACGFGLYGLLGIVKGDRVAGDRQMRRNFDLFDAPVGLFFSIDRDLGRGSVLDYGMFMQSIMLGAAGLGLATCPQAAWLDYHAIVSRELGLPAEQSLLCGMALGYEDPTAPINGYHPDRLTVDAFTVWHRGDPTS